MKKWFSRIQWRDVLTFLLFFVIAGMIWFGHALRSVRNTRVPVLIQYTGKPGAIGLGEEGLPDTIQIVVRDAGQRLTSYWREPLHLTIDLRPYIHGDKGKIHIPSDVLRRSISDILQGTSSLIETSPEEITCTYFTEQEKTVPIVSRCTLETANEYQLVGKPTLSHCTIKVFGQEKMIASIDTIYTVSQVLNNLVDTMRVRVALEVPAGVRAEVDSVDMHIIAERFTEKKYTLPIHVIGVPEGYRIRLFPHDVDVNVRVGMSHFADVQAKDVRAVCVYTPERKDKLEVELRYSNPFITAGWVYPSVVEFLLEQ